MIYPETLPLPGIDGYTLKPESSSTSTQFESGAERKRKNYRQPHSTFAVSWLFNSEQLMQFEEFFRDDLEDGVEWFDIDLLNGMGVNPMSARFMGEYSVSPQSSQLFTVTATLEVSNRPLLTEMQYQSYL